MEITQVRIPQKIESLACPDAIISSGYILSNPSEDAGSQMLP
jgi:hypothetical protein